MAPAGKALRKIRASWRDTALLLREFRQPLLLFALEVTERIQPGQTLAVFGEAERIHAIIHENNR